MFRQFLSNFITTQRALVCRTRRHDRAPQHVPRRKNTGAEFAGGIRVVAVGRLVTRLDLYMYIDNSASPTSAMQCLAAVFIAAASIAGRPWEDFPPGLRATSENGNRKYHPPRNETRVRLDEVHVRCFTRRCISPASMPHDAR